MSARVSLTGRNPDRPVIAVEELDQAAALFIGVRPRLIEIAYRTLGHAGETEDVVQEAWLRWQRTDRSVPDPRIGPAALAERGEAVERAVSLLLRNLTPTERAAYVLREAFGYPYQQIAEILPLSAAHTRQLVRRAHKRVAEGRGRTVNPAMHRRLLQTFRAAAQGGNLAELEQLLAADVRERCAYG